MAHIRLHHSKKGRAEFDLKQGCKLDVTLPPASNSCRRRHLIVSFTGSRFVAHQLPRRESPPANITVAVAIH